MTGGQQYSQMKSVAEWSFMPYVARIILSHPDENQVTMALVAPETQSHARQDDITGDQDRENRSEAGIPRPLVECLRDISTQWAPSRATRSAGRAAIVRTELTEVSAIRSESYPRCLTTPHYSHKSPHKNQGSAIRWRLRSGTDTGSRVRADRSEGEVAQGAVNGEDEMKNIQK